MGGRPPTGYIRIQSGYTYRRVSGRYPDVSGCILVYPYIRIHPDRVRVYIYIGVFINDDMMSMTDWELSQLSIWVIFKAHKTNVNGLQTWCVCVHVLAKGLCIYVKNLHTNIRIYPFKPLCLVTVYWNPPLPHTLTKASDYV